MTWLPSHTELRDHPKMLKAARALGGGRLGNHRGVTSAGHSAAPSREQERPEAAVHGVGPRV